MTIKETLAQLEGLRNEKIHAHIIKNGADENHFGVKLGDIRALSAVEIERFPSARSWCSIATIQFPRAAPHLSLRSGSTKW
ncbi:MAG: hypothetical protein HN368_11225 [Spirochaetales bacterium]|jgi:hypothetical protein|nr:hypothetical protein [Spirochaetales bacterium]